MNERVMEWLSSTNEERQALYRVVRAICDATDLSTDDVFTAARGGKFSRSAHDDSNFRKGTIGHKAIAPIFRWVVENHLAIGVDIAPEVFDPSLLTRWVSILSAHGIYDRLQPRLMSQLGLTQRSANRPIADLRIPLGSDFYFTLESEIDGMLLALETFDRRTYPFSLHGNGVDLLAPISRGENVLPLNPQTGLPDPLSDTEHNGLHSYTVLVGPNEFTDSIVKGLASGHPIKPEQLDRIALAAQEITPELIEIHRLHVIFTS